MKLNQYFKFELFRATENKGKMYRFSSINLKSNYTGRWLTVAEGLRDTKVKEQYYSLRRKCSSQTLGISLVISREGPEYR